MPNCKTYLKVLLFLVCLTAFAGTAGCGGGGSSENGTSPQFSSATSSSSSGLGISLRTTTQFPANTRMQLTLKVELASGAQVAGVTDQTWVVGQSSPIQLVVPANVPLTVIATATVDGQAYSGSQSVQVGAGASEPVTITMVATTPSVTTAFTWDGTSSGSGAFNYTQGSYLEGFEFTANTAITVTQLGAYDSNLASLPNGTETFAPVPVGLYDLTSNTLLGSTTVSATDPVTGMFHYAPLATPALLNTTDTYAVVWVSETDFYVASVDPTVPLVSSDVNAAINILGAVGFGPGGLTQTTTLVEPNFFVAGRLNYDLGPNFIFTN